MGVSMSVQMDLDEMVRDMDLLVFRLERSEPDRGMDLVAERKVVRRELESLRDRLERLVRDL